MPPEISPEHINPVTYISDCWSGDHARSALSHQRTASKVYLTVICVDLCGVCLKQIIGNTHQNADELP